MSAIWTPSPQIAVPSLGSFIDRIRRSLRSPRLPMAMMAHMKRGPGGHMIKNPTGHIVKSCGEPSGCFVKPRLCAGENESPSYVVACPDEVVYFAIDDACYYADPGDTHYPSVPIGYTLGTVTGSLVDCDACFEEIGNPCTGLNYHHVIATISGCVSCFDCYQYGASDSAKIIRSPNGTYTLPWDGAKFFDSYTGYVTDYYTTNDCTGASLDADFGVVVLITDTGGGNFSGTVAVSYGAGPGLGAFAGGTTWAGACRRTFSVANGNPCGVPGFSGSPYQLGVATVIIYYA